MSELTWNIHNISLCYKIWGIVLFKLNFKGIMCDKDIIESPELSISSLPPLAEMRQFHVKIAYLYSYPLSEEFPLLTFKKGYLCYAPKQQQHQHFFVKTTGSFENYLNSFDNKKTLSTLKRKVKKIAILNEGKPHFKVYSKPEEMDEFLNCAREISQKTYQQLFFNQGIPATEEFKQNLLEKASQSQVYGYILFMQENPMAYNYCPVYGENKVLYGHSGYLTEYADYSPGTVLHYKLLEHLFAQPNIDYYDLCIGEGKHKQLFGNYSKICGDIYYFPLFPPQYLCYVLANIVLDYTYSTIVAFLKYFGIKDKIRTFIRKAFA